MTHPSGHLQWRRAGGGGEVLRFGRYCVSPVDLRIIKQRSGRRLLITKDRLRRKGGGSPLSISSPAGREGVESCRRDDSMFRVSKTCLGGVVLGSPPQAQALGKGRGEQRGNGQRNYATLQCFKIAAGRVRVPRGNSSDLSSGTFKDISKQTFGRRVKFGTFHVVPDPVLMHLLHDDEGE